MSFTHWGRAMKYFRQYLETGRKEYHEMATKHFLLHYEKEAEEE